MSEVSTEKLLDIAIQNMIDNGWYTDKRQAMQSLMNQYYDSYEYKAKRTSKSRVIIDDLLLTSTPSYIRSL